MMDNSIDIYVKALLSMRAKTGIPAANFVVVTKPPSATRNTVIYSKGDRNNYCVAAVTRRLKWTLQKHVLVQVLVLVLVQVQVLVLLQELMLMLVLVFVLISTVILRK